MSDLFTGGSRAARVAAVLGVVLLGTGVAVLAGLALEHGATNPDASASPTVAVTAPPPTRGTVTPSPTPSPTPTEATPAPAADERFLAVRNEVMWRGVAGACGGTGPVVERSTDGGATWASALPPQLAGGRLLALASYGLPDADIVGAAADCVAVGLRTYSAGTAWEVSDEALRLAAFASPTDPQTIVTPGGQVAAPCPTPVGIRTSRDAVGLICDGVAYRLGDGSWTPLVEGALAMDAESGTLVVAHTDQACPGGATVTRYVADAGTSLGCIAGVDAAARAALSVVGGTVVLWTGDAVLRL